MNSVLSGFWIVLFVGGGLVPADAQIYFRYEKRTKSSRFGVTVPLPNLFASSGRGYNRPAYDHGNAPIWVDYQKRTRSSRFGISVPLPNPLTPSRRGHYRSPYRSPYGYSPRRVSPYAYSNYGYRGHRG